MNFDLPKPYTRRSAILIALSACFAAPALAETKGVPRTLGPVTMQVVPFQSTERAGTIHIYNDDRLLFRTLGNGTAERFDVFSKINHWPFPGGKFLRRPGLAIGMLYFKMRDML